MVPSKTLAIWALGIWVKYQLLQSQFSYHLHHLCIGIPYQSIRELRCIQLHGVDGSINPVREDVHLVGCTLHELPCILQPLSQWGVSGHRCQPFHFIPRTQDTIHFCVLESLKPCCQWFPLLLLKLRTQVDQLCLSIWSICRELCHIGWGVPWGCPPGHMLLMPHFQLHKGLHCQVATHSLITFIITIAFSLTVRDAGFFRAMGFLL